MEIQLNNVYGQNCLSSKMYAYIPVFIDPYDIGSNKSVSYRLNRGKCGADFYRPRVHLCYQNWFLHPYKSADISRKSIEESWSWSRSFWENLRRLKMALIFKSEGSATKGRYRAARQIKREVVICREVETVAKVGLVVGCDVLVLVVVVGGPRCDFCPNPAGQWKASPATRVFWKAAGLRNTPRKISHKQRKLLVLLNQWGTLLSCASASSPPRKVLFWAKIWVNGWLFESGNPVICADGAASAFSSVKLLSISQLCVKVLLNKNAQNIYQVDTNFQINFFGKPGLKRLCQTRKCDPSPTKCQWIQNNRCKQSPSRKALDPSISELV